MFTAWLLALVADVGVKLTILSTDKSDYIRSFRDPKTNYIYVFDDYNLPYKQFKKLQEEFRKKYNIEELVEHNQWRTHTINHKTLEIIAGELYRPLD